MVDQTLGTRPLNNILKTWLALHAGGVNAIASTLDVKPTWVVGGVLQEASTIITEVNIPQRPTVGMRRPSIRVPSERPIDVLIDNGLMRLFSGDWIQADYRRRYSNIAQGIPASWWQKAIQPTGNDIGWGNINLGTAMYYVKDYLANPSKYLADPTTAAQDPLGLQQYANDFKKLSRDLVNPASPATFKIAGLIAKQANIDFQEIFGPAFTNAPEATQTALIGTYFKQGGHKILQKHPFNPDQPYDPLSDPAKGSGGPFILDNFSTMKSILSGSKTTAGGVDWGRVGNGQTQVQTTPQDGANGQPIGEAVQRVVAPNGAPPAQRPQVKAGEPIGSDPGSALGQAPAAASAPRSEQAADPGAAIPADNATAAPAPATATEDGSAAAAEPPADGVEAEQAGNEGSRAAGYRQQAIAAHLARIGEAKRRIPDFDQVIRAGGRVPIAPGVADEILNSEKSALLQYHLAGNPAKLDELNALSGTNLARAVGRLEGRLYLPPAGTATEASPPLADVRGSAAPMFDPHTTDDMDAFADWLREDQARRRRA